MKKKLLTLLQIAVTLTVLYLVFRDPAQRTKMALALQKADWRWLLASGAVAAVTTVCATVRWFLLLRAQNFQLPLGRVAQIYFVGNFFNLFLLGSTGGDVVKAFYLLRETGRQKAAALLTVAMDRIIGLMALVFIAGIFIVFRYHWFTQDPVAAGLTATVGAILASALFGVLVTAVVAGFGLERRLPAHLPGRAKITELAAAFRLYGHAWPSTLGAFVLSMPGHGSLFATVWCGARALHLRVPFLDIAALMPIVNTFISLPVSVSGVGVREELSKRLLHALCGVPEADAVVIAEISFLSVMIYNLLGGVVYLFYRSSHGVPPAEATDAALDQPDTAITAILPRTDL